MEGYPRGSEWRKWDLHLHTPKSIIQRYGGDNGATWDAFIQKIPAVGTNKEIVDNISKLARNLAHQPNEKEILNQIDKLIYDMYDISIDAAALIEESVK